MSLSLREAFESVPSKTGGRACYVCSALADMGEEDGKTLVELLSSSVSTRVIYEACQKAGYKSVTLASLRRHRREECRSVS